MFDFRVRSVLYTLMLRRVFISWVLAGLLLPGPLWAVEAAPALTDREIAERLARLEEGLHGVRTEIGLLRADLGQLRADIDKQNQQLRTEMSQLRAGIDKQNQQLRTEMSQLRADMNEQNRQLREDMNLQFTYQFRLTLALLGAFTVLVAATISFALWDRRTMMRPLEVRVKSLEDDLAVSQPRAQALLESLRNLSQRDPELASILRIRSGHRLLPSFLPLPVACHTSTLAETAPRFNLFTECSRRLRLGSGQALPPREREPAGRKAP